MGSEGEHVPQACAYRTQLTTDSTMLHGKTTAQQKEMLRLAAWRHAQVHTCGSQCPGSFTHMHTCLQQPDSCLVLYCTSTLALPAITVAVHDSPGPVRPTRVQCIWHGNDPRQLSSALPNSTRQVAPQVATQQPPALTSLFRANSSIRVHLRLSLATCRVLLHPSASDHSSH